MTTEEYDVGKRSAWQFKREISIGNLITLAALAAPLAVWAINLDKRLTLVEGSLVVQQQTDSRQEAQAQASRSEIRGELQELNRKVDRVLDRVLEGTR